MSWDPSLVDPTNRAFDGLILRSVGGRTGKVTLENGQKIVFPWKAQQEITGSDPPTVQTQEVAGLTHQLWSTYTGGEFPTIHTRAPYLRFISSFPDEPSPAAIADIASGLVTGGAEALIRLTSGPTIGQIYFFGEALFVDSVDIAEITTLGTLTVTAGDDITIQTTGAGDHIVIDSAANLTLDATGSVSITSAEDITISTSGAGDDLILDPTGALTATGSSISLVSDGNGNVTITASGTGDLLLTGSPVSVNGTDISTPLGVWSAFTPTLSGTGTALGNGSLTGFYMKLGKLLFLRVRFTLGSTSTIGSTVSFALPAGLTAATETDQFQMFPGMLRDTGIAEYLGMFRAASGSTTITAYALGAGATYTTVNAVSSTVPHTWANTDVLSFVGAIEVA